MRIQQRNFRDAVDINCFAIINTVLGYDGCACGALAVKENIGMLSQIKVCGKEYLPAKVLF